MRGHTRKRGETWSYVIDLGTQKAQRCPACRVRYWPERRPLESCPKCGGALYGRLERRQREQGGFRTKRQAQAALTDCLSEMSAGTYVEPSKMTVAEFLQSHWLPTLAATVKPSTLRSYTGHVECHLLPNIGSIQLQKLTGGQLNALYAKMMEKPRVRFESAKAKAKKAKEPTTNGKTDGQEEEETKPPPLSKATIRRVHATIHRALRDAQRWNLIVRNPADAADPPKAGTAGSAEMKTWALKQLRAFLDSTKATRLYPLWALMASTGMRRGEALGLRWDEDVDLDSGRVSISQNMVAAGYTVVIGEPKTRRGRRSIALDPDTIRILKDFRKKQAAERLAWGPAYEPSGYVFVRENGQPYHPNRITKMFETAVEASRQPRIRLHDLRHTYATLALAAGVHVKVVSERLGHANVSITLDTYSHVIPALEEQAAAQVGALLFK